METKRAWMPLSAGLILILAFSMLVALTGCSLMRRAPIRWI